MLPKDLAKGRSWEPWKIFPKIMISEFFSKVQGFLGGTNGDLIAFFTGNTGSVSGDTSGPFWMVRTRTRCVLDPILWCLSAGDFQGEALFTQKCSRASGLRDMALTVYVEGAKVPIRGHRFFDHGDSIWWNKDDCRLYELGNSLVSNVLLVFHEFSSPQGPSRIW